jgi:hypothetical protein
MLKLAEDSRPEEYKYSKIDELTELVQVLTLQLQQQKQINEQQNQIDFIKSEIF